MKKKKYKKNQLFKYCFTQFKVYNQKNLQLNQNVLNVKIVNVPLILKQLFNKLIKNFELKPFIVKLLTQRIKERRLTLHL